ncbi:MAG: tetratricopeptide repeat protein, partial [Phycisphaerales bacterium JB050]
ADLVVGHDLVGSLAAIAQNHPENLKAYAGITALLAERPAEFNQWVAEIDQRATAERTPPAAKAALDIARINARLNLIPSNPRQSGAAALAAARTLGSYDILIESLLPKTVKDPQTARAVLGVVDKVERALRLTRPIDPEQAQPTYDRLETVNDAALEFVQRHTAAPQATPELVAATLEWLWTTDRIDEARNLAARWRESVPAAQITENTTPAAVIVEALIAITAVLPDDQISPNIASVATETRQPLTRVWSNLVASTLALRERKIQDAESHLQQAAKDADEIRLSGLFSVSEQADNSINTFLNSLAQPLVNALAADAAFRSGDTARAIDLWTLAGRERLAWDLPALQLLDIYRQRGNIGQAEAISTEAMLRGATISTGLSMIDARVDQFELGLIPYEVALTSLNDLEQAGFPEPPIRVARLRLAIIGSIRLPARAAEFADQVASSLAQTVAEASDGPTTAETLVRMLRAADELGVIANPAFVPANTAAAASQVINAQFSQLTPESKYAASLIEVARTGVYGPALERLIAETERVQADPDLSEVTKFDHQRILARFSSELARSYQAVEQQAYDRLLAFAENYPDNADAQLLLIDSLLRAGEIPPVRTEALTEALDRIRDTLGTDSYAYNFAESRRLYANPATRTPEVARQEIISRLDPFVEGPQSGSATVEVLHLVSKWWELLPNSLERRLGYLRRAQQTSPTAWGLYPDLVTALTDAGQLDDAATALVQWGFQLRPSLGMRSQRRDLAQFVGAQYNAVAKQANDDRSRQIQTMLWSLAVNDAVAIAQSTGERTDLLRLAQVLLAAPDRDVARAVALNQIAEQVKDNAAQRVDESRPATITPGVAAADLTVAAAFHTAVQAITLDSPDAPRANAEDLPALANAARLIAENAAVARLTFAVADETRSDFPATVRTTPEPDAALRVLPLAINDEQLMSRAVGLFYAVAYDPERWQPFADQARSAMLAAAAIKNITEYETRNLVYPLSQLGEFETAIALQRSLMSEDDSTTDATRINDVVAIAEILREAGQTTQAYAALDALSADDRSSLMTEVAPIGAQALVTLLELETGQDQTPVTNAFVRRVTSNPQAGVDPLQLAIESAADSMTRRRLLDLVSDDLVATSSGPGAQDLRPFVASLWFTAATSAPEDDPMRRDLLTQTITRLNQVAEIEQPGAKAFAYRRKAYCEIELGLVDSGIRTYRMALEAEPNDPATLNNLADALKRQGQFPEALQTSERAIAAARATQIPNSILSVFYDTYGGSNLAVGNVEEALAALQTALDLDATNNAARVTFAEAQLAANQSPELIRATIEPIGPAAEQQLPASTRQRLRAVREQLRD